MYCGTPPDNDKSHFHSDPKQRMNDKECRTELKMRDENLVHIYYTLLSPEDVRPYCRQLVGGYTHN